MSTHQRFKGFKRLVKEKVHQVFTSGSDSVLSTGSAPDVPSSTIDPASATSTASTASVFMPRAMPTYSGDPAAIGTWACLGGLLRILAEGSRVFGPLKTAVDGLAQCIAIYEVGPSTLLLSFQPNNTFFFRMLQRPDESTRHSKQSSRSCSAPLAPILQMVCLQL